MLGRISNPLGSIAIVGTIFLSGLAVEPKANTAHADDCLPAPKSSAPAGSHWYYRKDRATQRKCWHLGTLGESTQHPAVGTNSEAATDAHAAAVGNSAAGTPISVSRNGENTPALPRIETCAPPTHCLITIVSANKFQQVLAPNTADAPERRAFTIENNNTNGDSCWVYTGSDAASKAVSQEVAAGNSYARYWPFVPPDGVQATCASSSDTLEVQYQ